jgi:hypothetical protein
MAAIVESIDRVRRLPANGRLSSHYGAVFLPLNGQIRGGLRLAG